MEQKAVSDFYWLKTPRAASSATPNPVTRYLVWTFPASLAERIQPCVHRCTRDETSNVSLENSTAGGTNKGQDRSWATVYDEARQSQSPRSIYRSMLSLQRPIWLCYWFRIFQVPVGGPLPSVQSSCILNTVLRRRICEEPCIFPSFTNPTAIIYQS